MIVLLRRRSWCRAVRKKGCEGGGIWSGPGVGNEKDNEGVELLIAFFQNRETKGPKMNFSFLL